MKKIADIDPAMILPLAGAIAGNLVGNAVLVYKLKHRQKLPSGSPVTSYLKATAPYTLTGLGLGMAGGYASILGR